MILDQSKKMYFGKYYGLNTDCVQSQIDNEIQNRTLDTEKLKSLVNVRILELNELLEKIPKVEKRLIKKS